MNNSPLRSLFAVIFLSVGLVFLLNANSSSMAQGIPLVTPVATASVDNSQPTSGSDSGAGISLVNIQMDESSLYVSWQSTTPVTGWLEYGNSPDALDKLAMADRGNDTTDVHHFVSISDLAPSGAYFVIVSNGVKYSYNGFPFKVIPNVTGAAFPYSDDMIVAIPEIDDSTSEHFQLVKEILADNITQLLTEYSSGGLLDNTDEMIADGDIPLAALELLVLDFDGSTLTLNLSASTRLLSEAALGELMHQIDLRVTDTFHQLEFEQPKILSYQILVDGQPLFEQQSMPPEAETQVASAIEGIQGQKIVLSPGHGRYDNGAAGWPLQRVYYWGIVEDFVNTDLVIELNNRLSSTGADRRPTRQLNKSAGNHHSGYAWWEIDASEYIRNLGAPESVWRPNGFNGVDRDIAARPEYANWIGANALVSIHNNGSSSGTACGTETWYDTNNGYQAQSQRLASLIQSKLITRIRQEWNPSWCDRGVKGSNGGYGENRRFRGPAVIVEVAFMDNTSDNAALKDARFRSIVAAAIHDALVEFFGGTGDPDDNRLISSGQTLNGTINPANDQDTYYFDASQGQRATIRMNKNGSSLDSYLILYAPNGAEVTRNDDSGGDLNSLINNVALSQSGRYRLSAASYGGGSGGAYTLSLQLASGVNYTPPSGYTLCAYENQRCSFSDRRDVAYGANGVFTYRYGITGGIDCTNAVFGDPLSGVVKACFTRSAPLSNLAQNRPASAWSQESSSFSAGRGNDGNQGTRWSSAHSSTQTQTQWWWVDLGSQRSFNQIKINWEAAYASSYFVGWSDATNCSGTYNGYNYNRSSSGWATHNVGNRYARCIGVKMMVKRAGMANYSFWELEAYNLVSGSLVAPGAVTIDGVTVDLVPAPDFGEAELVTVVGPEAQPQD